MVLEITGMGEITETNGKLKMTINFRGHQICATGGEECVDHIYIGEFELGPDGKPIPSGYGELFSNYGKEYEGEWKNNMKEGTGKSLYIDGKPCYDGEWKNDMREGRGKLFSPFGKPFYDGDWKGNLQEGKGRSWNFLSGKLFYDGDWKSGKREGKGKSFDSNGKPQYDGDWKNDVMEGKGVLHFPDGSRYDGNWENGKKNGLGIYTDQKGYVVCERLYSKDLLKEQTAISWELYKRNGEINSGEKRKLYTTKYDENGDCSTVTYYYYGFTGILERELRVNYRKLNELLNEGKLSSIVPGAIEDVTEGLEENARIGTLEGAQQCLRVCARQYLQDRMCSGEWGLDEGGIRELQNLMLLASLKDSELRRVRFSDKKFNTRKMEKLYENMGTFLEFLGINLNNLDSISGDFIITTIATTSEAHSVTVIIDLKRLRELKDNGEDITTTNKRVMFIFDGSRIIGDPRYRQHNLGNIQKNCVVVNQNIQGLGSCWYHAVSSTMAMARNSDIFGSLRDGTVAEWDNNSGEQVLQSPFRIGGKLPTRFEIEHMLQLQEIANEYNIGVINDQLISKLIVLRHVRDMMENFLDDRELFNVFEERIDTLVERREKEEEANFDDDTRKNLGQKYKNQLPGKIEKIIPEFIREKYSIRADTEGERFLLALERVKALYDIESEFSEMLLQVESTRNNIGLLEIGESGMVRSESDSGTEKGEVSSAKDNVCRELEALAGARVPSGMPL